MTANTTDKRIHALDGLRAIAVILVFLNHLNVPLLLKTFPLLDWLGLFSSGVTGVTWLFVLSGFLMTFLYPTPTHAFTFIQKRYTRIFPLFLTMCSVWTILSIFPHIFWLIKLLIILLAGCITHIIWVYGIQKIRKAIFSNILFFSFFFLQIVVGLFYAFWIMRHPPIYLQQLFPGISSHLFTGMVNATLTFPLGDYIPMLDGVYWSLAAEILFYVIYPFLVVPLVLLSSKQPKPLVILFILTLFPLIGGINILAHHIFVLSALQPALFAYFVTGITLGYLYRVHQEKVLTITSKYSTGMWTWLPFVMLAISITGTHLINNAIDNTIAPWVRIAWAIPYTMMIATLLNKTSAISRFLGSKLFVFVGTISYSIYLAHSIIIHIVESFYTQKTVGDNIGFLFITFGITLGISSLLYFLLEKPYFLRHGIKKITETYALQKGMNKGKMLLITIPCVYIISIFFAFQSPYNFFALVIPNQTQTTAVSLKTHPTINIPLVARENNLGIIAVPIQHIKPKKKISPRPTLLFRIREHGNPQPLFSLSYALDEFHGDAFPFGVPMITDSKEKAYDISFSLQPPSQKEYVIIDTQHIAGVYQPNKSQFIKNPKNVFTLLQTKIENIFTSWEARLTLFLLAPYTIYALYVFLRRSVK